MVCGSSPACEEEFAPPTCSGTITVDDALGGRPHPRRRGSRGRHARRDPDRPRDGVHLDKDGSTAWSTSGRRYGRLDQLWKQAGVTGAVLAATP
ncbi:hypothetical protein [Streptomyces sp. NBC_00996]|uniref:hypothetical protein n=1 Tax=Streptomyces sp. NBC_00996 TaxID=2903710 RepID=UPI00386E0A42|nr:hypothetical protein OG390_35615 [Streptomyces sp. NBC_00996]